jgi:uncharacterized protein (DUF1778 family)
MATKDERLEMRVSKSDRDLIENAADQVHENISDFTRSAAVERAQHVLARSNVTMMPAAQFDALLNSLDEADEAPALAEAFARPRRFGRG